MDRRHAIRNLSALFTATAGTPLVSQAADLVPDSASAARDKSRRGLPPLKITDIKVIRTSIGRDHLTNVKVYTNEPGLYGIGCGTHSERSHLVAETLEKFVKPMVVGRRADEIEKIWQELWVAPYWRASVDASNAMSALDGALWDILGKRCGLPVHDLLGGKVRDGLRVLADVNGATPQAIEDGVRKQMEDGYQHFRIYLGNGGEGAEGGAPRPGAVPMASGLPNLRPRGNDAAYTNKLVQAFDHLRKTVGFDIDLGHDVHEQISPSGAVVLAKAVEPYRPFFIEDLFAPEDSEWYKVVRAQSAIGIAMGELFVNQNEWLSLVSGRLIDFMRMHISAVGGLSVARRVAHCCEFFGVQTAWHGPRNVSPVGHAVNLHVDLSIQNFGICEGRPFTQELIDMFPGAPEIRRGVRYGNGRPGLGVDLDEKVAAKFPPVAPGSNRSATDMEGAPKRP